MIDVQFTIKYYADEIQVHTSKCLGTNTCNCKLNANEPKCCYTGEEARALVIKYYKEKADYLEKLTVEQFLYDQGYYHDR